MAVPGDSAPESVSENEIHFPLNHKSQYLHAIIPYRNRKF